MTPSYVLFPLVKGISMTDQLSRRRFFKTAAFGAAAIGLASSPQLLSGPADAAPAPAKRKALAAPTGVAPGQAVTAYVRDYRTGEIAVMVGDKEVIHRDAALARRLARIASRAK